MSYQEIVRNALENLSDIELATHIFDEIGGREMAIKHILEECPRACEEIYLEEKAYLDIVETDRAYERDWQLGRA